MLRWRLTLLLAALASSQSAWGASAALAKPTVFTNTEYVEGIAAAASALWVATRGGVEEYDLRTLQRRRVYTTNDGLPTTAIPSYGPSRERWWPCWRTHAARYMTVFPMRARRRNRAFRADDATIIQGRSHHRRAAIGIAALRRHRWTRCVARWHPCTPLDPSRPTLR